MNSSKAMIVAALVVAALGGCAAPAEPGRMVPDGSAVSVRADRHPLAGRVAIGEVGGGEVTNPMNVSKVGSDELREALRLSLDRYGFLSGGGQPAPFRLGAFLVELKQPQTGFILNVHAFVRYTLRRTAGGELLFDEVLDGSYTATFSDSAVGLQRLKIANEGAVRQSLAALIRHLEALSIPDLSAGRVGGPSVTAGGFYVGALA